MICAIVLAAGRSQRMGTQKLLLPIGGKPVITRIVDQLLQSLLQEIIVVVGRDAGMVQAALPARAVTFVTNPDFDSDMISSIRCGLRTILNGCKAVLVVLGDQPNLTSQLVTRMIAAYNESGRGIIVPSLGIHRGHPVLLAARFGDELLRSDTTIGLRGLLDAHPDEIFRLDVPDASELEDMDTREDYQRHLDTVAHRTGVPSPAIPQP